MNCIFLIFRLIDKLSCCQYMGLDVRKPVFGGLRTAKAQTSRLISAFVIRFLESIIYRLDTSQIKSFYLVSVAEEAGLNLTFPEDRFSCDKAYIYVYESYHVDTGLKVDDAENLNMIHLILIILLCFFQIC